jgi:serine/threonine protein phosphatase PrpC
VRDNFTTGMTKTRMIELLLDYCQRREIMPRLLAALERDRPDQYRQRFGRAVAEPAPVIAPSGRDPRQIFISHAHQDAGFAHRLAANLQKHGWRAWIAPDSIRPGEKWIEAINRGLEESGVFLVVLTPTAVGSEWVKTETNIAIELAHRRELRFIPLEVVKCRAPVLWTAYQHIPFSSQYGVGLAKLLSILGDVGVHPSAVVSSQHKPPGENTSVQLDMEAFWATDVGVVRDHNEDTIGGTPENYPLAMDHGYLFLVVDGRSEYVASSEFGKRVYRRYYTNYGPNKIHHKLEFIVREANNELYQQAQANPAQQDMCMTMTAAVIKDNRLFVAHVGDGRLYLIRNRQIKQVTSDHSWVEKQVRAGMLTRPQVKGHPQRNILTRAIGREPDLRVDLYEYELLPGDVLVLCSDGLSAELGDALIAALATEAPSAETAVRRLIELANANGGEDNISVCVIRLSGKILGTTTPTESIDRLGIENIWRRVFSRLGSVFD